MQKMTKEEFDALLKLTAETELKIIELEEADRLQCIAQAAARAAEPPRTTLHYTPRRPGSPRGQWTYYRGQIEDAHKLLERIRTESYWNAYANKALGAGLLKAVYRNNGHFLRFIDLRDAA